MTVAKGNRPLSSASSDRARKQADHMLLARIVETTKRTEKVDLISTLLKQARPDEIEIAVAFLSGRATQGRIGIGYGTVRNAMAHAAENPSLEITDLDRAFQSVAAVKGQGAERERTRLLNTVLARATEPEQRFTEALLLGGLRQGALEGIMLEALSKASGVSLDRVRHAVMVAGDITAVARTLLETGEAGLAQYDIQLFRPVQPMLAQTAEDVGEALSDLGEAALEFKLDDARVKVHRSGDEVAVFTRRLNNVTAAVPEIVEAVRALPAKELILDGGVEPCPRWPASAVSNHHAAIRPQIGCRADASGVTALAVLVRLAVSKWQQFTP